MPTGACDPNLRPIHVFRQGKLVLGAVEPDQRQYYTGEFQTVSAQSTGYYGIPVTGVNVRGNMFNQSSMPENPWGKVRLGSKKTAFFSFCHLARTANSFDATPLLGCSFL